MISGIDRVRRESTAAMHGCSGSWSIGQLSVAVANSALVRSTQRALQYPEMRTSFAPDCKQSDADARARRRFENNKTKTSGRCTARYGRAEGARSVSSRTNSADFQSAKYSSELLAENFGAYRDTDSSPTVSLQFRITHIMELEGARGRSEASRKKPLVPNVNPWLLNKQSQFRRSLALQQLSKPLSFVSALPTLPYVLLSKPITLAG